MLTQIKMAASMKEFKNGGIHASYRIVLFLAHKNSKPVYCVDIYIIQFVHIKYVHADIKYLQMDGQTHWHDWIQGEKSE